MSTELLPLTDKQSAFCAEYLKDLNGAKAAIRAGYSAHTARDIACELMEKPHVRARIQELMDERSQRTKISADRVLNELARVAFIDVRSFYQEEEDGRLRMKSFSELSDDDAACIAGLKFTDNGPELKVHDKLAALEKIGKHLKLFTEKSEVDMNNKITQMGRIQTETVDASGNVVKKSTLTFNVGAPVDGDTEEDEENDA